MFIFGPANELRQAYSSRIAALDRAARGVILIMAHGPTKHVGAHYRQLVVDDTESERQATSDWDSKFIHEADHRFEVGRAEDEFIALYGIKSNQLPCIAFFTAGLGNTPTIISLPPVTWGGEVGRAHLFGFLEARLNADVVLKAISHTGESVGLHKFLEALGRDITASEAPPGDLITMSVALARFLVSRSTLTKDVAKGKLTSYRKPKAGKNATHLFSDADLASRFPRRGSS